MKTLMRVALRYGAVGGGLAILVFIVSYYTNRHPMMVSPYLDFRSVISGVLIFFALREIRDYYQQGILFFWQAMVASGVIVVVMNVVASIGIYGFGSLEPRVVSGYIEEMTQYLQTFDQNDIERIGKDLFESNFRALPDTNLKDIVGLYFGRGLVVGFFVSIILSVILRKQPKN
jgi:uncharacterized membrane-anchored protein YitT (DUF2179 family)